MGGLLVIGPVTYWLYARVTGEEAEHPALTKKVSRTVFLTLWVVSTVVALACIIISFVSSVVPSIFGMGGDAGALWVDRVLPGLFAAITVGFGIAIVLKHASRRLVLLSGAAIAVASIFLLLVNLVMVVIKKDMQPLPEDTKSVCTYRMYSNDECTYREYMQYLRDTPSSSSNSRPYSNNFEQYFN